MLEGWAKFEYFNFPLNPNSALHIYLQQHFAFLTEVYFDMNFIDKLGQRTDIGSVLIN